MNYNKKHYGNKNNSDSSLSIHIDKKYDSIPFRLQFLEKILSGNDLHPLIDINKCDTEYYINPNGYRSYNSDDMSNDISNDSSSDIRFIINKKLLNFYKVINGIGGRLLYIKSGTSGHTFKGIVTTDDGHHMNYAVKVVAYPKKCRYGSL